MSSTPKEPRKKRGPIRRGLSRLLSIMGIERSPESRFNIRIRRRFLKTLAVLFLLFIVGMTGLYFYSTSPRFCRSCHIMEPYYQAWENSHHKDVSCVECHYPPADHKTLAWKKFQALSQVAKYVTRTYSPKPYAEVEDASCLRSGCHSTRLLRGRVMSESGIRFDHGPHLEGVRAGRQLRCTSCHSQVVMGKHIEVTWDTCYLCHLKGRKEGRNIEPVGGCLGCHEMPAGEIQTGEGSFSHKEFLSQNAVSCENCHQNVVQGEAEVTRDRCYTCHNDEEKLARIDELDMLHDNHVTQHNTACFHCHREIRHSVATAGTKDLEYDCSVCHTDTHDIEKAMYRGRGVAGVPASPSPMYLANVDCVACHALSKRQEGTASVAQTYVGTEDACRHCHGEQYEGTLHEGQELVDATAAMLGARSAALRAAVAQSEAGTEDLAAARKQLADADHALLFVDSATSAHNIYYAASVLRHVDQVLSTADAALEAGTDALEEQPLLTGAFCATMCHEKFDIDVPRKEVLFNELTMPHRAHFEEMEIACTSCHQLKGHKNVSFIGADSCLECHDADELKATAVEHDADEHDADEHEDNEHEDNEGADD